MYKQLNPPIHHRKTGVIQTHTKDELHFKELFGKYPTVQELAQFVHNKPKVRDVVAGWL